MCVLWLGPYHDHRGPSASRAAVNSWASFSVLYTRFDTSLEYIFVHRLLIPLETKTGPSGNDFAFVGHQGLG
jgi:hypothetical protein